MLVPHGSVQQRTVEVPIEVTGWAPCERVQQRTVEHVPVPQTMKETVEAVAVVLSERVQQRTVEQIAGAPKFMEETFDEMLVPRERVQQRINEQIVKVPLPRSTEDVVDVGGAGSSSRQHFFTKVGVPLTQS